MFILTFSFDEFPALVVTYGVMIFVFFQRSEAVSVSGEVEAVVEQCLSFFIVQMWMIRIDLNVCVP